MPCLLVLVNNTLEQTISKRKTMKESDQTLKEIYECFDKKFGLVNSYVAGISANSNPEEIALMDLILRFGNENYKEGKEKQ